MKLMESALCLKSLSVYSLLSEQYAVISDTYESSFCTNTDRCCITVIFTFKWVIQYEHCASLIKWWNPKYALCVNTDTSRERDENTQREKER